MRLLLSRKCQANKPYWCRTAAVRTTERWVVGAQIVVKEVERIVLVTAAFSWEGFIKCDMEK